MDHAADMEGSDPDAMSASGSDSDEWVEDAATYGCLPLSVEGSGFQGTQFLLVPWIRGGQLSRFTLIRDVGGDQVPETDAETWMCVKFDIARVDTDVVRSMRRGDAGCLFWQYAKHLAQGLEAKLTLEEVAESFVPKLASDKYSKGKTEPELSSAMREVLLYWSRRLADRPEGVQMFKA